MLALIDGLRTKLTALSDVVQSLVNKPASTVPYSQVGDIYFGDRKPPNPEPGYAYQCESITNSIQLSGYSLSAEEIARFKPWRARVSWTTAPEQFGWNSYYGTNDELDINTIGRKGSIIVNKTKRRLYISADGHVVWKEFTFPNQDKCSEILFYRGGGYDDAGHLLAEFNDNGTISTKLLYVSYDYGTRGFIWKTLVTLEEKALPPAFGGVIDFDADKYSGSWAILYWSNGDTNEMSVISGGKYDEPANYKLYNLGTVKSYLTVTVGFYGGMLLLTHGEGADVYDPSQATLMHSYLYAELPEEQKPAYFSSTNKPVYSPPTNGWVYINATGDTMHTMSGPEKKVTVFLTFSDWLNATNLDIEHNGMDIVPEKFYAYLETPTNSSAMICVHAEVSDTYGGGMSGPLFFYGFDTDGDGKKNWVPVSPVPGGFAAGPAVNCDNGDAYFLDRGSYRRPMKIYFSQCHGYSKDISIPPIPGGWCITGKYKLQEEV